MSQTTSHQAFSEPWARAWADQLRDDEAYRKAAATWEGSIALEAHREGEPAGAVFADLWHGECRTARAASVDDLAEADYVIRAALPIWKKVMAGKVDPIFGLMSGKLKLSRGKLAHLTPYISASKALVRAAARVPTHFPGDDAELTQASAAPSHLAPTSSAGASSNQIAAPGQRHYRTTSEGGLDHGLPVMGLWHKGKKLGVWDPRDIDFTADLADWRRLADIEREVILHLTSLFQAGEESVTLDLLPLIQVIAGEGRLEEEMYLTSFLFEEAKHVEVFRRFLDEVAEDRSDLSRFHGDNYRLIFYDRLPTAMSRLRHDSSPAAQAEASVTYNMIVEGVLAETGYHAYGSILERNGLMPGMQQTVGYLKADESRHLAYGVYLLSRLVIEHGEPIWRVIEQRMEEMLPPAIGLIHELFEAYEEMPFGLELEAFTDFAMGQFQKRMKRIERARRQSLDDLRREPVRTA